MGGGGGGVRACERVGANSCERVRVRASACARIPFTGSQMCASKIFSGSKSVHSMFH